MKSFYRIIQLIIITILSINIGIFFVYGEYLLQTGFLSIAVFLGIMFFQFVLINFLIKKYFYSPILDLEINIKNFLTGNLKDKDINFKKTSNTNLNYILLFFSKTLNTLKNIKSEFMHGKEIKGEVELAKDIQGQTLDKKLLTIPSLEVIVKSKPAGEIGGDSFDIISENDNYFIYVGDATGHGVGAGFIMIMVNSLISAFAKVYKRGNTILARTNEILKPRVKANLLMSLLLVRWEEKTKKLFMTGAGHEYLMIYKHSLNKVFKIKSGGVALGMIKNVDKLLNEKEIQFEKNDIIVLYSDGITEAINQSQKDGREEMFGEDRLMESIQNSPFNANKSYKSARSVFNNITIDLSKFMGYKHCQLDDVTLACVHYKGDDYDNKNDFEEEISDDFITEWNWK